MLCIRHWIAGGIGLFGVIACGRISDLKGPEYEIVESRVTTPAGTEHIQVRVPQGVFKMGAAEGDPDERPVHEVELDAFYIDKFQVTNAQYMAFVEMTGFQPPPMLQNETYNQPQQPVVGIPFVGARDYCAWAGLQLPTEAQWEKAAGGTDGRFYPWGNERPTATRANYNRMSTGPMPVGSFPAGESPYGASDMAGNVWEWMRDLYDPDFYARSPRNNPANVETGVIIPGGDRTLRGGGWKSPAWDLRVSARTSGFRLAEQSGGDFYAVQISLGFRCVRVMP